MYQQVVEDLKLSARAGAAPLLERVSRFLAGEGILSYLVGGFIRDMLLGRDTADIDIAVDGAAPQVARRAAAALGGKYVLLDELNGVARVIMPGDSPASRWQIDFSTLKGGDIAADLAQRDLTIDAMAVETGELAHALETESLRPEALIDPCGGREDLQRHLVRAVSQTSFSADAIRLLRAVRLAAELGFSIEDDSQRLIRLHSHLIGGAAGERLREELLRILAVPRAGEALSRLDELGLLTQIIPELAAAKGVTQPLIHHWEVFAHSIETVKAVAFLLRQSAWEYADAGVLAAVPWSDELSRHFALPVAGGSSRQSLLKLAALLHDIAKPGTKTLDASGRARFTGHPAEGAEMAAGILERLRFSTREIKLVQTLVSQHMRPGQMSGGGLPTPRAIYRYFRDTGDAGTDILFFSLADHLATRGPHLDPAGWREHARLVAYVLEQRLKTGSPTRPPRLIDGNDLIKALHLGPGPQIGRLLEAVREAQAAGEVNSREEALSYAGKRLSAAPDKTKE